MDFGLNPTGHYPRIIRFVEFSGMPEDYRMHDVVSVLDEKRNVLTVNQDLFERCDPIIQGQIIRTTMTVLKIN